MQGTIKRIIRDRGFGFIRTADGQEVFFHRSSLQGLNFDALKEGSKRRTRSGKRGQRTPGYERASEPDLDLPEIVSALAIPFPWSMGWRYGQNQSIRWTQIPLSLFHPAG